MKEIEYNFEGLFSYPMDMKPFVFSASSLDAGDIEQIEEKGEMVKRYELRRTNIEGLNVPGKSPYLKKVKAELIDIPHFFPEVTEIISFADEEKDTCVCAYLFVSTDRKTRIIQANMRGYMPTILDISPYLDCSFNTDVILSNYNDNQLTIGRFVQRNMPVTCMLARAGACTSDKPFYTMNYLYFNHNYPIVSVCIEDDGTEKYGPDLGESMKSASIYFSDVLKESLKMTKLLIIKIGLARIQGNEQGMPFELDFFYDKMENLFVELDQLPKHDRESILTTRLSQHEYSFIRNTDNDTGAPKEILERIELEESEWDTEVELCGVRHYEIEWPDGTREWACCLGEWSKYDVFALSDKKDIQSNLPTLYQTVYNGRLAKKYKGELFVLDNKVYYRYQFNATDNVDSINTKCKEYILEIVREVGNFYDTLNWKKKRETDKNRASNISSIFRLSAVHQIFKLFEENPPF